MVKPQLYIGIVHFFCDILYDQIHQFHYCLFGVEGSFRLNDFSYLTVHFLDRI